MEEEEGKGEGARRGKGRRQIERDDRRKRNQRGKIRKKRENNENRRGGRVGEEFLFIRVLFFPFFFLFSLLSFKSENFACGLQHHV